MHGVQGGIDVYAGFIDNAYNVINIFHKVFIVPWLQWFSEHSAADIIMVILL